MNADSMLKMGSLSSNFPWKCSLKKKEEEEKNLEYFNHGDDDDIFWLTECRLLKKDQEVLKRANNAPLFSS